MVVVAPIHPALMEEPRFRRKSTPRRLLVTTKGDLLSIGNSLPRRLRIYLASKKAKVSQRMHSMNREAESEFLAVYLAAFPNLLKSWTCLLK